MAIVYTPASILGGIPWEAAEKEGADNGVLQAEVQVARLSAELGFFKAFTSTLGLLTYWSFY